MNNFHSALISKASCTCIINAKWMDVLTFVTQINTKLNWTKFGIQIVSVLDTLSQYKDLYGIIRPLKKPPAKAGNHAKVNKDQNIFFQ